MVQNGHPHLVQGRIFERQGRVIWKDQKSQGIACSAANSRREGMEAEPHPGLQLPAGAAGNRLPPPVSSRGPEPGLV